MASWFFEGKVHYKHVEPQREAYSDDYCLDIPQVMAFCMGEGSIRQAFDWTDDSIVVRRNNIIYNYTRTTFIELKAVDKEGKIIWVDGRNAPSEDEWDGHYLGSTRQGQSFKVEEINLAAGTKTVYECVKKETIPIDRHDKTMEKYLDSAPNTSDYEGEDWYEWEGYDDGEEYLDEGEGYDADENDEGVFVIKENKLVKYRGKGGSVVIPDGVTSIGGDSFSGCSGLTSITIPESVTSIGSSAFKGCSGLTSITIPDSVTSIGDSAFEGCSGLTSITIPNSVVTSIGSFAFLDCSGLTSITIPNRVTSIGFSSFNGCSGLTSIAIPDSVTSIGSGAFSRCSGLTSITIPDSVTSIGKWAFSGCSGLTSIEVNKDNPTYRSENNCLIEKETNVLIAGCKTSVIPNSVTSIGDSAFSGCSGLTSITIPDSVTSIGDSAFASCGGLTSITIPNSVTSIGINAFYDSGLTNIKLPDGVTYIEEDLPF